MVLHTCGVFLMVAEVIASQRCGIGAGAGDGFPAVGPSSGQSGGWAQHIYGAGARLREGCAAAAAGLSSEGTFLQCHLNFNH